MRISSTVIRLLPRAAALAPASVRELEQLTRAAFGQRRKMLRQSLKAVAADAEALLAEAGIAPTRRAETLEVEEFCETVLAALARGAFEVTVPRRFGLVYLVRLLFPGLLRRQTAAIRLPILPDFDR